MRSPQTLTGQTASIFGADCWGAPFSFFSTLDVIRPRAQSRLSMLFNAMAKIPMQFFILFIGAMVFVFYLFVQPPLLFHHAELSRNHRLSEYQPLSQPEHPA